jgi:hypothetical protein
MRTNVVPFSVYGVPLMGLLGLVVCLWHPQCNLRTEAVESQTVVLVNPNPKLDRSMTVFLIQEAKNVAYSRKNCSLDDQAKTIADYNLIAQECTPAVFQATHLPSSL